MKWDIADTAIEANLKQLLAEAPSTRCGACGTPMEAESVEVHVSVSFDWYDNTRLQALGFVPAFPSFSDPTRYSGHVRYVCPKCGASLRHQQVVTPGDGVGIFHFQPPNEG